MKRLFVGLGVALFALLLVSAPAQAAELASEEVYRLPSGETINDDLYLVARRGPSSPPPVEKAPKPALAV